MLKTLICDALLFLVLLTGLPSQLCAKDTDPIFITPEFKTITLAPECLHRVGRGFLPFESSREAWSPVFEESISLCPDSVHWLYAAVKNTGTNDRALEIHLHCPMLTEARLYVVDGSGVIDSSLFTGSQYPLALRATRDKDLSLPLLIPSQSSVGVYISLMRREIPASLFIKLTDPLYGDETDLIERMFPAVLGFCVLMLLTAIVLLFYFRTLGNVFYLIFTLGGNLYLLALGGYGALDLWPRQPWFEETSAVFFLVVTFSGFILFSRKVLNIAATSVWADRWLLASLCVGLVLASTGLAMGLHRTPSGLYRWVCIFTGSSLLVSLLLIFYFATKKAIVKHRSEYWWFNAIFFNLLFLSVVSLAEEANLIHLPYTLKSALFLLFVPLELFLTQVFLVTRTMRLLRTQRLRELDLLRRMDREHFEISRELHDDIGSGVKSIGVWAQLLEARMKTQEGSKELEWVQKIVRNVDISMEHIRTLMEATNPVNKEGEKLVAFLRDLAYERLSDLDISTHFEADEGLDKITLAPQQLHHLILVFKESLNNIVRHAEASQIHIALCLENKMLYMKIQDNGIGFDPGCKKPGNGLENMRRGSEDVEGAFEWHSAPGEGFMVRVGIPLNNYPKG
jgi:signal transduction histidine kinase